MLNWLRKSFTPSPDGVSISSPDSWFMQLFGAAPTIAGAAVSPLTAMRVPAVNNAVRAISETIGELPVKLLRRLDTSGKEEATDHAAYGLVHDEACDWLSASQFRTQLTTDALLHDAGFAFVNRVNGNPVELIRLPPDKVTVRVDAMTSEPRFEVRGRSGTTLYGYRDILYLPCHSIDGVCGLSPIKAGREAIALAIILETHASRLFASGARPSGALKFTEKLDAVTAQRIKNSWTAAHSGANAGGTAVLEQGGDFIPITFNSVDAQFLEMRAHQIEEIARLFRVPPVLLMDYGRATWSNAADMGQQFLTYTLLPWMRSWEAAYRRVLLTEDERRQYSVEFIVDDLLRADMATRATAYSQLISARVLNPNEARARESLPPYAGGEEFVNSHTTSSNDSGAGNGQA